MSKRIYILLFILSRFSLLNAQTSSNDYEKSKQPYYGLSLLAGSVIVHTPTVENTRGTNVTGFSLQFAKQLTDKNTFDKCGNYPQSGVNVSYVHFTKKFLGDAVTLDYFLQPVIKLSDRLEFQFKGLAGICYLTNPNDSSNAENRNYSTYLNAHFNIGTGFGYRINDHFLLQGNADFQHVSNGAFKHPNAGINWLTGSVSLLYYPLSNKLTTYHRDKPTDWKNKKPNLDAGLYYVPPQGYYWLWLAKRNYVSGGFVQVAKMVSPIDDISFGAEVYYNNITPKKLDVQFENNHSSTIAGIMAGHDFIFRRVYFSQQFGIYLTKKPSYYPNVYQRYGLSYLISSHLLAGFNLKAHGDEADFADLRIVYRFHL